MLDAQKTVKQKFSVKILFNAREFQRNIKVKRNIF